MKKIFEKAAFSLGAVLLTLCVLTMPVRAASGSTSLGVSSSSVNIGDSVSVTLNVSSDVYASFHINISYSSNILEYTGSSSSGDCNGSGGALAVLSEVQGGGTYSVTMNFKAIAPGSASISASTHSAIQMDTAESFSISGSGTSVTVNNAASNNGGGGNNNGGGGNSNGNEGNGGGNGGSANNGDDNANKSADNSLKSLTISPGTLSPAFKYSTTKYTATVGADVTSIAVDAQVSNANASVESVTGNKDLKPGANTVKIVVKAENGTLATYTITVTRGGAATEDPEETPEEEDPGETPETGILIGGKSYKVCPTFPEDLQFPEEFEKSTATYQGEEVEVYNFSYGNLKLYYLQEETSEETGEGNGGCYFYNEGANAFFPYVNVPVGNGYVIPLPSSYNTEGAVPEGYETAEVLFGEAVMEGFRLSSLYTEGLESAGDFYLIYGVNRNGTFGWYQYDSVEGSLQRFVQLGIVGQQDEEQPAFDEEKYQKDYSELQEKYRKEKDRAHLMMCVAILVAVVAVIAIVNILIFGRRGGSRKKKNEDEDIDFIDFDDL